MVSPSDGKSGTKTRGSTGSQWLEAEPPSAVAVMNHHPMKHISLCFWFPSWWKMQDFNKVAEQMELIYSLQLHSSYCILLYFPFLIGTFCFPSRTRVHKTFSVKGQAVNISGFADQMISLAPADRYLWGIGSRTFCRYQNLWCSCLLWI